jgi:hypothetical protein
MERTSKEELCTACPATIRPNCDRCRTKDQSRRKYVFTDQIDQLIRELYLNHRDAKTRPGIRLLAKKGGMPHWVLKSVPANWGCREPKSCPGTRRS